MEKSKVEDQDSRAVLRIKHNTIWVMNLPSKRKEAGSLGSSRLGAQFGGQAFALLDLEPYLRLHFDVAVRPKKCRRQNKGCVLSQQA